MKGINKKKYININFLKQVKEQKKYFKQVKEETKYFQTGTSRNILPFRNF